MKRGQEEIVGFVLIMVIVAVVFLVFLGISLRQGSSNVQDSTDVYQFLESSFEYTTECSIRFQGDLATLGELFNECNDGRNCLTGEDTCVVLNETLEEIFDSSWRVGPENPVKGLEFESFYVNNENRELIISFVNGDCNSSARGASYISPAFPGKIESNLEVCF